MAFVTHGDRLVHCQEKYLQNYITQVVQAFSGQGFGHSSGHCCVWVLWCMVSGRLGFFFSCFDK